MTVQQIAARVGPGPVFPGTPGAPPTRGPAFADLLARATAPEPLGSRLTVSAHAAQRLTDRAITLTEPLREQIAQALDTLGAKGANDALLLGTDAAFVVNVPNRTVVTALAPDEMHDRVVTQIDSALIL